MVSRHVILANLVFSSAAVLNRKAARHVQVLGNASIVDVPIHLSRTSPCGPSSQDELLENGVRTSASWHDAWTFNDENQSSLKFFLRWGGAFDFDDMVACYFDAIGGQDRLDLHVLPEDAEHSTDVPLLRHLSGHSRRTWDAAEAAIHVIGAPLNTAWLATHLQGSPCGDEAHFRQRLLALVDELRGLAAWNTTSRRFVFIDSDWRVARAFGHELMQSFRLGHAILASADHKIAKIFAHTDNSVVIPYRAHFLLEDAARDFVRSEELNVPNFNTWDADAMLQHRLKERPVSFSVAMDPVRNGSYFFSGNMHNRMTHDTKREALKIISQGIVNASVTEVDFQRYSIDEFVDVGMTTAQTMLQSSFCFVPCGDTPSTRRLFDALAAGCVPIIFGNIALQAGNLPFPNTINWGDIAIFAGDLKCAQKNQAGMKEWLKTLIGGSREIVYQVEQMRRLGRIVFRRYLSYMSSKMVPAFLGEFEFDGNGTLIS